MRMSVHHFVLIFIFNFSAHAQTLDLDGYLNQVVGNHQGLEGLRISVDAAEKTRMAGDSELIPEFNIQGTYLSDRKLPGMLGATETRSENYSATLSKRFSTGTKLALTAQTFGTEIFGLDPTLLQALGFPSQYAQGGLGVTLTQSLWKNGFGRATRLRQSRQALQALVESESYNVQSRQILANAEIAFWDYLYLKEELRVHEASLARAKRLESWLRRRVRDGIANKADQLNGEALVATREIQIRASKDQLIAAENRLKDFITLSSGSQLPSIEDDIEKQRSILELVNVRPGQMARRLDVQLSEIEARSAEASSQEVLDASRSDLNFQGSYFTNTYAPNGTAMDGTTGWTQTNIPTVQVGLSWTYKFDTDIKDAAQQAARGRAMAAQLKSERATLEGVTAWTELLRRHRELTNQIASAEALVKTRARLSKAQQDNYARGRTISSEVINSEQSAAESELQYIKMCAEQRKLEAQSRLFVAVKE